MCTSKLVGSGAMLALLIATPLHAQAPGRDVRGRVVEAADSSRPVVAAEVHLAGTPISARTDNSGAFLLRAVPPGEYELGVRRLGFKFAAQSVSVAAAGEIVVNVTLQRATAELTEVVIEGKRVWVPPRLGEVYARGARGWGKLFTADDIRQQNPSDLKALLNTVPTVHTNDRGITFNRCQAGLEAVGLALSGGGRASATAGGSNGYTGRVEVFVDGMRMTSYSSGAIPGEDANKVLKGIHPSSVAAMEVYTGVARLPGEFHSDACAAIAIWTKSY